jgi:acyl-homoserine lactone acylase PvdQ
MYLFHITNVHNLFIKNTFLAPMKKALVVLVLVLYSGCSAAPAKESVVIYRDVYGVPHIVAASDRGAFFGVGYAQAQDHLEIMMKHFAQATGRLARIEGKKAYKSDVMVNALGIPEIAHSGYNELSLQTQEAIEAFCDGVNTYMRENKTALSDWMWEVEPEEVVAFSKYVMLSRPLGRLRDNELLHVTGKSLFDIKKFTGGMSNEWVVSGSKTASGNVMLQADPHLPWEGINQWYEVHIRGETINVAGATLFGLPVVIIGFNEDIAWTMTANSPDTADVYQEKIKKEDGVYLYDEEWIPVEEKRVDITVDEEIVDTVVYYTHHGPVIAYDENQQIAYAAKLSTVNECALIEQMLLVNKASNFEEFNHALSLQQFVRWNIVYGDVEGNIYYVYNTRTGIRDESYDWDKPVPGWTSATEWKGVYPFDALPQELNGEGFYQNCNVAPWFINDKNSIEKVYPAYVVPDTPLGYRGQRALQLLSQEFLFTVEDMMAFSLDTYSLMAEEYMASVEIDMDEKTKKALDFLKEWDFSVEKESDAPLLFTTWLTMGGDAAALKEAVDYLEEMYGRFDVLWGDVHVVHRGDTYPVSGSAFLQTLFMTGGTLQNGREYCDHGSSYLLLVELGTPVKAYSLRPFGQSEHSNSPHYADMTELYSKKQYKPFFFTEEDILANMESKITLEY